MLGLALLGVLTAVAHHLYNKSMHGVKVEGDPQWPPRFGNALSFFIKIVLIGAVQIAYKQQAWVSFLQAGQFWWPSHLICVHSSLLRSALCRSQRWTLSSP